MNSPLEFEECPSCLGLGWFIVGAEEEGPADACATCSHCEGSGMADWPVLIRPCGQVPSEKLVEIGLT